MKKQKIRKLSILGLILAGTSMVTAAVIPNKSNNNKSFEQVNGSLTVSDCENRFQITCEPALIPGNPL